MQTCSIRRAGPLYTPLPRLRSDLWPVSSPWRRRRHDAPREHGGGASVDRATTVAAAASSAEHLLPGSSICLRIGIAGAALLIRHLQRQLQPTEEAAAAVAAWLLQTRRQSAARLRGISRITGRFGKPTTSDVILLKPPSSAYDSFQ